MSINPLLKRGAQIAAAGLGRHRWPARRGELLILTYHRILPPDDPRYAEEQPGMVVHPETFRIHLKVVKDYFEPVSLSDWLDRAATGRPLPRRACALTLDDGWRDNYEYAYPHLREEGFPATIFLVSDYLSTSRSFWPERLTRLVRALAGQNHPPEDGGSELAWLCALGVTAASLPGLIDRERLDTVVVAAKRLSDVELNARLDRGFAKLGLQEKYRDILRWKEVHEMLASGLVDFGSHTRAHIRMHPGLDSEQAMEQIRGSREAIESRLGSPVKLFCYPNGDMTEDAERLVRAHYQGACTTEAGWNRAPADPYRLRRIGLHQDMSADSTAFLARVSGLL
jgi:peptidoglycan/xylan/chitin deacetylase (PgdA/CDA1 family)